jgi:hypothetical protein
MPITVKMIYIIVIAIDLFIAVLEIESRTSCAMALELKPCLHPFLEYFLLLLFLR